MSRVCWDVHGASTRRYLMVNEACLAVWTDRTERLFEDVRENTMPSCDERGHQHVRKYHPSGHTANRRTELPCRGNVLYAHHAVQCSSVVLTLNLSGTNIAFSGCLCHAAEKNVSMQMQIRVMLWPMPSKHKTFA